jgi:chemotaxis protein MotB
MAHRRKKGVEEHSNHERWLVSYADFITLLFAFFVVMYAISSVNEGKYQVLSNSISHAFSIPLVTTVPPPIIPFDPTPSRTLKPLGDPDSGKEETRRKQREKMQKVAQDLSDVLEPLLRAGKVKVTETSKGVSIEISDSVLFSPGQALLGQAAEVAMRDVANVLANADYPITIEGHTDTQPIKTPQFPSNWELSAVRATTVLRLFIDTGVPAGRLTAIGYGDQRPVETNDYPEGRARNRRVNILVDASNNGSDSHVKLNQ